MDFLGLFKSKPQPQPAKVKAKVKRMRMRVVQKSAQTTPEDLLVGALPLSPYSNEDEMGRLIDYSILHDAYRLIDVLRGCVDVVTRDALAHIPYLVEKGTTQEADENIQNQFRSLWTSMVNDQSTFADVMARASNDIGVYDDLFIEVAQGKVLIDGALKTEIYNADARYMRIMVDPTTSKILNYAEDKAGKSRNITNPIIHRSENYLGSRRYGCSRMLGCLNAISVYFSIWKYLNQYYSRSAVPLGIVMYSGMSVADWQAHVAETKKVDAREPVRTRTKIKSMRASDPNAKASWIPFSVEAANVEGHLRTCIQAFLRAYCVPAIKLGMAEEGKMTASEIQVSNYYEGVQRRQLSIKTVIDTLLPYFQLGDFQAIFTDPKDSDRLRQATILNIYKNNGTLSRNECRREIDYEPTDGGDDFTNGNPQSQIDLPNISNPLAQARVQPSTTTSTVESTEQ